LCLRPATTPLLPKLRLFFPAILHAQHIWRRLIDAVLINYVRNEQ
jgi:hypothetical protein